MKTLKVKPQNNEVMEVSNFYETMSEIIRSDIFMKIFRGVSLIISQDYNNVSNNFYFSSDLDEKCTIGFCIDDSKGNTIGYYNIINYIKNYYNEEKLLSIIEKIQLFEEITKEEKNTFTVFLDNVYVKEKVSAIISRLKVPNNMFGDIYNYLKDRINGEIIVVFLDNGVKEFNKKDGFDSYNSNNNTINYKGVTISLDDNGNFKKVDEYYMHKWDSGVTLYKMEGDNLVLFKYAGYENGVIHYFTDDSIGITEGITEYECWEKYVVYNGCRLSVNDDGSLKKEGEYYIYSEHFQLRKYIKQGNFFHLCSLETGGILSNYKKFDTFTDDGRDITSGIRNFSLLIETGAKEDFIINYYNEALSVEIDDSVVKLVKKDGFYVRFYENYARLYKKEGDSLSFVTCTINNDKSIRYFTDNGINILSGISMHDNSNNNVTYNNEIISINDKGELITVSLNDKVYYVKKPCHYTNLNINEYFLKEGNTFVKVTDDNLLNRLDMETDKYTIENG